MLGADAVTAPAGRRRRARPTGTGSATPSPNSTCGAPPALRAVPGNHVHRRRADEAGDEGVDRVVVEVERAAGLLDDAVAHHDDLVGHRHRLDLVVRHVDRRRLEALVQLLDLGAHLHAQLRVEVRQRLVEQEHLRIADDRAAHRDALPLAAGELARIAVEIRREARMSAAFCTRASISAFGRFASISANDMLSRTVMCG